MGVELKSNWQDTEVELLRSLHGYELADFNEEMGCVDYITAGDGEGKKLLRVVVDSGLTASRATFEIATKTLESVEGGSYDAAIIVAEGFTSASKRLARKEGGLDCVSPDNEHHSLIDLIEAVQRETQRLCELRCGKFPASAEDCRGYRDGEYTCPVRRVSDDADFHVERRWPTLLKKDFSKLVELRREMEG